MFLQSFLQALEPTVSTLKKNLVTKKQLHKGAWKDNKIEENMITKLQKKTELSPFVNTFL